MAIKLHLKRATLQRHALDHQRLMALMNTMSDGFLAVGETGKIVLCNSAAYGLLDSNSLEGKALESVFKVVDTDGGKVDIQKLVLRTTKPFSNRDWKIRYNDGSSINVDINISPIHLEFGAEAEGGYVVLVRDITREKTIEAEREEFVSVASHELRTPVAIAEGSISNALILAERAKTPDAVVHSLAAAHDQIIFLSNLINDLSMLSRAERGKLNMEVEAFNPSRLVESLALDYSHLAKMKKLALYSDTSAPVSPLHSSQLYVREILQNFVTNAIKYTEKGTITISVKPKGEGAEFTVSDTGIGISKSEQAKVFDKFYRGSDWRVKEVNGTGLGLYVCAKLAKVINAKITATSELNKGSSFSLYVPHLGGKNKT